MHRHSSLAVRRRLLRCYIRPQRVHCPELLPRNAAARPRCKSGHPLRRRTSTLSSLYFCNNLHRYRATCCRRARIDTAHSVLIPAVPIRYTPVVLQRVTAHSVLFLQRRFSKVSPCWSQVGQTTTWQANDCVSSFNSGYSQRFLGCSASNYCAFYLP
jgi:hypothetical protein